MGNTRFKFITACFGPLLIALAFLPACQKKCQPVAAQAFKHLAETTWRAVETSNPKVSITKFDFIEMAFKRDFTGDVIVVKQNLEFNEKPVEVFTWAVPDGTQGSGQLRIQYSTPGDAGQNGAQPTPPEIFSTDDYVFALGTELTLDEVKTGYHWRFVPMSGIVDPDSDCVF